MWGSSELFLQILLVWYRDTFVLYSLKILICEIKVSILFKDKGWQTAVFGLQSLKYLLPSGPL